MGRADAGVDEGPARGGNGGDPSALEEAPAVGSGLDWAGRLWGGSRSGPAIRFTLAVGLTPIALNAIFARNPPLGILANGLVLGSLYGLTSIGIVLVYRASKIISFAQSGLGAVPAVAAYLLWQRKGLYYPIAVVAMVCGAVSLGLLVDVLIARRFRSAPRLIFTVATIGLAQVLTFVEVYVPRWIKGDNLSAFLVEARTPFADWEFTFEGVVFSGDHVVAVTVVVLLTGGLGAFLRWSRFGLAIRASAENEDRAALVGISAAQVTMLVWAIAAVLSSAGVFLRIPLVGQPLGGSYGTTILLFALAGAVIGRMESLTLALAGAVFIGVLDQATFYSTRNSALSSALLLPIILAALLLQRDVRSRAYEIGFSSLKQVASFRPIPTELHDVTEVRMARMAGAVVLAGLALGLPFLVGEFRRDFASLIPIYALVGVSLVLLTGWAGQISLGHFAFSAVGAAVAGGLAADANADFIVSLVAAGVAGAVVALLVGVPALRLPGLMLAVTTLGFAANVESFVLNRDYFAWLLPEDTNPVYRPVLWSRISLESDLAFYYASVAVLVLGMVVGWSIRSSRSGRVLIAARENPRAAQALGVNLARTKLAVFAISGFIAAVAGAMFVYLQGALDRGIFTPSASINLFMMAVIGGMGNLFGAVAGATYIVGFKYFLPRYELLASGAGVLLLLMFFPGGLSELGFRLRDAFLRWVAQRNGIFVPSLVADTRATDVPAIADDARQAANHLISRPSLGDGVDGADLRAVSWVLCPLCGAEVLLVDIKSHDHFVEPGPSLGQAADTGVRP